jgi:hypothetical protein
MSLKSITIPASVTTISDYAFSNCQSLEDVTVTQTIPIQIKENTFNGILLSKVTLHVPPGTEAIYRATPIWKDFNLATTVNNEQITPPAPLQTWSANGTLHITGLCPGKPFSLHTIHGQLIHKSTARTTEETIPLHTPGIYILTTEKTHIKISL